MTLTFRTLRASDEGWAVDVQRLFAADRFKFLVGYAEGTPFATYLAKLERQRVGQLDDPQLPDGELGIVPATFWVALEGAEVVGRVSIRHRLNPQLEQVGGHIGFGVLPAQRRRGYGTQMLHAGLGFLAELGVEQALLTCSDDNLPSQRLLERARGRYTGSLAGLRHDGTATRHYWFATRT